MFILGITRNYKSRLPVVVVGNISVGGTGKTPFIQFLVAELAKKNIKAGIVSRGYGAKINNFPHLVDESDNAKMVGDEVYMLYRQTGVPIAISPKRSEAVKLIETISDLDLIISDDGLQHYAMDRQYEYALVDGQRGLGNRLMLPFGPLREPVSRLKSVDQVIVNGKSEEALSGLTTRNVQIEVVGLVHIKSGEQVTLSNLSEHSVTAVAGIGNPDRFFKTLAEHKTSFNSMVFDDHHDFCAEDFDKISSEIVVMTEKDSVKCLPFAKENWYFLKIRMKGGEQIIHQLINRILEH